MPGTTLLLAFAWTLIPVLAFCGPVEDCDRLAADPELTAPGVPFDSLEGEAAKTACAAAVAADPTSLRLFHQYARALEKTGDLEGAKRLYRWAAEDGLAVSQKALDRLGGKVSPAPAVAAEQQAARSLEGLVQKVGNDPEALRAAIQSRVGLDLYVGSLRGPETTWAAAAGNSLDVAKLLAEGLRRTRPGAQLRFAHCDLDAPSAQALAQKIGTARRPRTPLPIEGAEAALAQGPAQASELQGLIGGMAATWNQFVQGARDEAGLLGQALQAQSVRLPALNLDQKTALARRHFWVQILEGDAWRDLDATGTIRDSASQCTAMETAPEIPAAFEFRLQARLVVEEAAAGSIRERNLLDQSFSLSSLPATGITLLFGEAWGLQPAEAQPVPAGIFRYTPVLLVQAERIAGQPLDLPRPRSAPADNAFGDSASSSASQASTALDGPAAEPTAAVVATDSPFRRLRLLLSLSGPGLEPVNGSRTIFDRRPPDEVEGQPADPKALLPWVESDGEHSPMLTIVNVAGITGVSGPDLQPATDLVLDPRGFVLGGLGLLGSRYDAVRQALFSALAGNDDPAVLTSPGLSLMAWEIRVGDGNEPIFRHSSNLLRTGEQVTASAGDPTETAIRWAVASVFAERFLSDPLLVERWFDPTLPQPKPVDVQSVFDAARREGTNLLYLKEVRDLDQVQASAAAKTLMQTRLAQKQTLLVPQKAPQFAGQKLLAWWVIDPAQGRVFDEFEDGTHSVATEEGSLMERARRQWKSICRVMVMAGGVGMIASIAIGVEAASPVPAVMSPTTNTALAEDVLKLALKLREEREKSRQLAKTACERGGP